MKHIILVFFAGVFFLGICATSNAAKREFRIQKITFETRKIAVRGNFIKGLAKSNLRNLGMPHKWGIVETVYGSLPKWADDVDIKYYVLLEAKESGKKVMLAGSIVYIDVESGNRHISDIYIPPQVLRRYGKVLYIRAEVWYNGILQDAIQWGKRIPKIPWWTRIAPTEGALMNRFYTPFQYEAQMNEELIKMR